MALTSRGVGLLVAFVACTPEVTPSTEEAEQPITPEEFTALVQGQLTAYTPEPCLAERFRSGDEHGVGMPSLCIDELPVVAIGGATLVYSDARADSGIGFYTRVWDATLELTDSGALLLKE